MSTAAAAPQDLEPPIEELQVLCWNCREWFISDDPEALCRGCSSRVTPAWGLR